MTRKEVREIATIIREYFFKEAASRIANAEARCAMLEARVAALESGKKAEKE
jgi:hypothetical protein